MRLECSVFFCGVDELAVGTLQVAFDHVVLEVVDGLGLVLHVVVAAATAGRRRRPPAPPRRRANARRDAHDAVPKSAIPMMSFMIRFSFDCREPGCWVQTTASSRGSKLSTFSTTVR